MTSTPKVRVATVTQTSDHRYYCDPCGELGTGPNRPAALARARRHAARHPDHWVSASHLVMSSFFAEHRPATGGTR